MSKLSSFIEQQLYDSIRAENIKTTQKAVLKAYELVGKLPTNTLLDIIANDDRFNEMYAHMVNIIAYNLSIKLVEYSSSSIILSLLNDGYLVNQQPEKSLESDEKQQKETIVNKQDADKLVDKPVLLCKTVKPNTSIPKKTRSWSDDDEDELFEKEQAAKLEKEKLEFEQYKSYVLKNNTDWSMKIVLSNAKTKEEIDVILNRAAVLKAEQAKAEQAKAEQAKAEQAKAEQAKVITPKVSLPIMQKTEKKLDSRFYTKPPVITNKSLVKNNNPNNLKYNKNPERLKTVTSSRFFMDGDKKYNKVPEEQDWYAWDYDTETMLPYGWRKVGTFPDKYVTSSDSPYTLINNEDGTWSVQETYSVKTDDGKIRTVTEYITIEYYIWCLTPPYYRKNMKQPAAN